MLTARPIRKKAMRTTLDIDEDLLKAAKELARQRGTTAGKVVSELLRRALTLPDASAGSVAEPKAEYGFRPFGGNRRVVKIRPRNRPIQPTTNPMPPTPRRKRTPTKDQWAPAQIWW